MDHIRLILRFEWIMAKQSAKKCPVPLVLVLLLLLGVFCRISQEQLLLRITTFQKSDQTPRYVSSIPVGRSSSTVRKPIVRKFSLSTNQEDVSFTFCSNDTSIVPASFSLIKRPASLAPESTVTIKNVQAICRKRNFLGNALGLGAGNLSFSAQVTKAVNLPHIFWYCLGTKSNAGEINFGRKGPYTVYYNSDVLNATSLPIHYMPLTYDSFFKLYFLSLDGVATARKSLKAGAAVIVGNTGRYTGLPEPAYELVRDQFMSEAASNKLKRDSSKFGELDLCYKMTLAQRASFSKVKLVFKGGAEWAVSPDNYLEIKNKDVVCFGFVNSSHYPRGMSFIGTLQQENNFIEYDVAGNKLGVSGSLAANLGLSCSSTRGT